MDLMGGKSLQITFFKLLNYKSRDTNWFFVPVSLWFINIFSENYSNAAIILLVPDANIAQADDGDELN